MLNVIRQRKRKWIGHVLRHYEFLQEIFEGRMKENQQQEGKEYSCSTIWLMGRTMLLWRGRLRRDRCGE